jgi:hypothetical protein
MEIKEHQIKLYEFLFHQHLQIFFNEREVLIKKVFTALRDEMGPFGIQIIDCDLRWGVNVIKIISNIISYYRFQKIQQLNKQY